MGAFAVNLFRSRVGNRAARVAVEELNLAIDRVVKMINNRCDDLEDMRDQALAHGARNEADELDTAIGELDDMAERIENGEWRKVKV